MPPAAEPAAPRYPDLLDVLRLSPAGEDRFGAGAPRGTRDRLFGGQLTAQALRAACATVDVGQLPHIVQARFLRPGRVEVPLELQVDRVRTGRAFATRRVTAVQDGATVLDASCSFHTGEPGEDWPLPVPPAPQPGELPARPTALDGARAVAQFELRPVHGPGPDGRPPLHPLWVRRRSRLPDDPVLHACALAFVSDFGFAMTARRSHPRPDATVTASLDHTVWFHRPARADEWLLLATAVTSTAGSRCLVEGTLRTAAGVHVASVAQVALVRERVTAASG